MFAVSLMELEREKWRRKNMAFEDLENNRANAERNGKEENNWRQKKGGWGDLVLV